MADYQHRVSQSLSGRMRLNRFRRRREKSSFGEEFRVVPRWLVITVVSLWVLAIAIGTVVNLGSSFAIHSSSYYSQPPHQVWPWEFRDQPVIASLILAATITGVALPIAAFLLLLGYVFRDAQRRGMRAGPRAARRRAAGASRAEGPSFGDLLRVGLPVRLTGALGECLHLFVLRRA